LPDVHWGFAPNPIYFFVLIQKSKQKNQGKPMLHPALTKP